MNQNRTREKGPARGIFRKIDEEEDELGKARSGGAEGGTASEKVRHRIKSRSILPSTLNVFPETAAQSNSGRKRRAGKEEGV